MNNKILVGLALASVLAGVFWFVLKDDGPEKSIRPDAGSPPPAPAMLSVQPGVEQVRLSWRPVNGALSYNVYWSTESGFESTEDRRINRSEPYYDHVGLSGDVAYYYIVTAVNVFGEGRPSREVEATAWPPPTAPAASPPPKVEEASPPMSEEEFHRLFMNRLMSSERPGGESPDDGEPTWDPDKETPPPGEEWPDAGEPTWDPNKETPPPGDQWPGVGETPKWSPHDEPQRVQTPF